MLLNNRKDEMSSRTEALLMCASRAQLTKDVIIPDYFVFPVATGSISQPENLRKNFSKPGGQLRGGNFPSDQVDIDEVDLFLKELEIYDQKHLFFQLF